MKNYVHIDGKWVDITTAKDLRGARATPKKRQPYEYICGHCGADVGEACKPGCVMVLYSNPARYAAGKEESRRITTPPGYLEGERPRARASDMACPSRATPRSVVRLVRRPRKSSFSSGEYSSPP